MKKVDIYTDGACSGNPGIGGWACVLIYLQHELKLSGGERLTTNNRMELLGVINGLAALKEPCEVAIYSDSAYIVNAFEKGWYYNWQLNNWKKSENSEKDLKNVDLWQQLSAYIKYHKVTFHKVKGHSDVEYNNMCDLMARNEIIKIKNEGV